MPIDLLSTIKKTSQFAFSSPLLNNLLGSSLFTALVITTIIILLIMFIYPAKKDTPLTVVFKLFIYSFCASLLIVFLHDGVIKHMFEEKEKIKIDTDIMYGTNINNRDVVYSSKPITPNVVIGSGDNDNIPSNTMQTNTIQSNTIPSNTIQTNNIPSNTMQTNISRPNVNQQNNSLQNNLLQNNLLQNNPLQNNQFGTSEFGTDELPTTEAEEYFSSEEPPEPTGELNAPTNSKITTGGGKQNMFSL